MASLILPSPPLSPDTLPQKHYCVRLRGMDFDRPREGRRDTVDDLSFLAIVKRKLLKKKTSRTHSRRRLIIIASLSGVVLGVAAVISWRLFVWQPANADPFTPQLAASLQFPLFHPTYVPTGFHVDTNSVTEPTTDVVVFNLDGPNKQKIYISEEARPSKYDIGGFFTKFSDLKETAINGGTLATGKIDNGQTEIGSMLNNQVWIISNTNAPVPMNQITQMVRSLTSNVATKN